MVTALSGGGGDGERSDRSCLIERNIEPTVDSSLRYDDCAVDKGVVVEGEAYDGAVSLLPVENARYVRIVARFVWNKKGVTDARER